MARFPIASDAGIYQPVKPGTGGGSIPGDVLRSSVQTGRTYVNLTDARFGGGISTSNTAAQNTTAIQAAIDTYRTTAGSNKTAGVTFYVPGAQNAMYQHNGFNLDNSWGIGFIGDGGLSSGQGHQMPSTLLFKGSGSGAGISCQSSDGASFRNLGLIYDNASFTGNLIDFNHAMSGVDASNMVIEDCLLYSLNSVASAKCLVSLCNAIIGLIHHNKIGGAQYGVRLQEFTGGWNYSNSHTISNNEFDSCIYQAITNPGQQINILNNTFEHLNVYCGAMPVGIGYDGQTFSLSGGNVTNGTGVIAGNWFGDPGNVPTATILLDDRGTFTGEIRGNFASSGALILTGNLANLDVSNNQGMYVIDVGDYLTFKKNWSVRVAASDVPAPATVNYTSRIVRTIGGVSYWRLNETSGTVASDRYGAAAYGGNNGTYTGGFTLNQAGPDAADATSKGVLLNGTTGFVTIPDQANLRVAPPLTLEAWVKPTAVNVLQVIAMKGAAGAHAFKWAIGADSKLQFSTNNDGTIVESSGTLTAGAWQHVAVTWDGVTARHYINGAASGTGALATATPQDTGAFLIGASSASSQFFGGTISDLTVYQTVPILYGPIILEHYTAGATGVTYGGVAHQIGHDLNVEQHSMLSPADQRHTLTAKLYSAGFDAPGPTITPTAALGTGGTVAIYGNDTIGVIDITAGTASLAAGALATVTFTHPYDSRGTRYDASGTLGSPPVIQLTTNTVASVGNGGPTLAIAPGNLYVGNEIDHQNGAPNFGWAGFDLCSFIALPANGRMRVNYLVVG